MVTIALKLLQKLVVSAELIGQALVPHFRQVRMSGSNNRLFLLRADNIQNPKGFHAAFLGQQNAATSCLRGGYWLLQVAE